MEPLLNAMLWRTRLCRPYMVGLLFLLSLLAGVVVFLVHRDWLPDLAGSPMRRELPVGNGPPSDGPGPGPGPYPYIINEANKCPEGKAQPFLVLLITTAAGQVEARDAIRQTWGNESLGLIRLFLLGVIKGELGRLHQMNLESESQRHHDIIQQDFLDTYNNLTLKTLMGMNWVAMHCPRATYVMKTDSDMFVNTDYLIRKLLRPELNPKKNYFTGHIVGDDAPIRDKNSKYYMSPEEYPGEKYPPFCSGTGYVFSGDLAAKIYRASLSIPHLHLEDVYVAICLTKLWIELTLSPQGLFNRGPVPYSSCKYSNLITSHGIQPSELLKHWHEVQNSTCINA